MKYTGLNLNVIEARIDWITATASATDRAHELVAKAAMWTTEEADDGMELKQYRFSSYVGVQSRHIRWGMGLTGGIVVVSGEFAQAAAYTLATLADHWSRVDYCVTVSAGVDQINPPDDYWEEKKKEGERRKGEPVCSRTQELWGGATWYIGKRISPYYCRTYDKHAESKGDYPPGTWRWESELKRHASEAAQSRCCQDGCKPHYVKGFLANEYAKIGLTVPWRVDDLVTRDPQVRHRPDVERKLKWLHESVAPSVEFCREMAGDHEVAAALGLPIHSYG